MQESKTKSKTSNWSKKKLLGFSLISVLLILIIIEILCRINFLFTYRHLHTTLSIQGGPLQLADSASIFKNAPFYVDYDRKFQQNEEGMKSAVGDEFIGEKQTNDFWVLLTGGSAMEGMGANRNGEWLDISGVNDHPYNETIAFYLQQMLQNKMPDKKVKVFNAAVSSYTICQSYQQYLSLAEKLHPDWVISMDGVNDPSFLEKEQTTEGASRQEWKSRPQFHFPLNLIVPLTKNSALANSIKQKIFHAKQDIHLQEIAKDGFPARKAWGSTAPLPIQYARPNTGTDRAINSFSNWIMKYDSMLTKRKQQHLLLIQPYIAFRETTLLGLEETAVNTYYRAKFADSTKHLFLRTVYQKFSHGDSAYNNIVPMDGVNTWNGWVFVDYCHFTNDAIKKISKEIYDYIASNGHARIFSK